MSERRIGNAPAEPKPAAPAPETNDLGDLAAKYGFVSGLLELRHDVAAYGCIDDVGPQIVLDKVKRLSVYDPDPSRIEAISQKIFDPWRFGAQVHDILEDPLPAIHDAIYNLDTLEYVSPSDEDRYLVNLSRSLSRHQDILIIGTAPCDADDETATESDDRSTRTDLDLNADRWPFELPRVGGSARSAMAPDGRARYRRTSAGVRTLLENHFRTVSLFSMTDGVVQAGVSEAGDYLFALCSSKKR